MNSTSTVEVATHAVSPPPSDWADASSAPSDSPALITARARRLDCVRIPLLLGWLVIRCPPRASVHSRRREPVEGRDEALRQGEDIVPPLALGRLGASPGRLVDGEVVLDAHELGEQHGERVVALRRRGPIEGRRRHR